MMTKSTDPLHIAVSKSRGVTIDWADGHRSEFACGPLRDACPCASCTGAHGNPPQPSNYSGAQPGANPFQIYQPKLKMLNIEEVGSYAFRIDWSDGHNSGIYSYDYLRRICPCAECTAARAAGEL